MTMKKTFYALLAVLLMGAGIGAAFAENPLLEDAIALHDDGRGGDKKATAEAPSSCLSASLTPSQKMPKPSPILAPAMPSPRAIAKRWWIKCATPIAACGF